MFETQGRIGFIVAIFRAEANGMKIHRSISMKPISLFPLLAVVSLLGACAAFEGKEYSVNAYDARGRMLNKRFEMDSNKAGIPVARSVLCKRYPHATVRVYNNFTGQEVREYSPHSCRR